ncbi:MAG: hypothetical protein JW700_01610 [Candidatus Aenigmarchaeota archaeon]|nr:hypothetical protein [Candidatus Aenigmarchaeota archaeon]
MVEFFIETSIDKLIGLIRERKRLKLSDASKILKVSQKRIDDWVFMLEDKGIVDLKYPVLGEPEIVLKCKVSDDIVKPRKKIELENRIIPGKPIKKENLPKFEPSSIPDNTETKTDETIPVADEIRSLEKRIAELAEKREESSPNSLYITERLRSLEKRLNDISSSEKEERLSQTERIIIEKLEKIEKRMDGLSKKVNKEDSSKQLKKGMKIKGTDNV